MGDRVPHASLPKWPASMLVGRKSATHYSCERNLLHYIIKYTFIRRADGKRFAYIPLPRNYIGWARETGKFEMTLTNV